MGWTEWERIWPILHIGFGEKREAGIAVRCRKAEMGEERPFLFPVTTTSATKQEGRTPLLTRRWTGCQMPLAEAQHETKGTCTAAAFPLK